MKLSQTLYLVRWIGFQKGITLVLSYYVIGIKFINPIYPNYIDLKMVDEGLFMSIHIFYYLILLVENVKFCPNWIIPYPNTKLI